MMDICSDCDIDDSFPESNKGAYNDSSFFGEENFFEFNPNDFLVQKNKGINYNEFLGNLFFSQYKEDNDYIKDDNKYQEQLYFFSNLNKETNLTDINANKPKRKLFEIKKENVPKYFTENSINNIIKRFNINKELKLKLLLDTNTKNNEIEQIKRVLESDTKKRRKRFDKDLYRTDHILKKLINIINSSLLNFINNLIGSLYSKERIYLILEGIIPSNEIEDSDLKNVIKKNDFIIRGKLETKEEKLNLLNLTIKKYLCGKISRKYTKSNYPSNFNELIINKILKDEDNKDIINFILNDLLIKDWLEIFLYKKSFEDFNKYNSFDKEKRNKIKGNLERIDKYINKIYNKKNKNKIYFHCFFLIAYNLYRFLSMKEKRNRSKIDNQQENGKTCCLKSLHKNTKIEN
jgi:hypothetical protein